MNVKKAVQKIAHQWRRLPEWLQFELKYIGVSPFCIGLLWYAVGANVWGSLAALLIGLFLLGLPTVKVDRIIRENERIRYRIPESLRPLRPARWMNGAAMGLLGFLMMAGVYSASLPITQEGMGRNVFGGLVALGWFAGLPAIDVYELRKARRENATLTALLPKDSPAATEEETQR